MAYQFVMIRWDTFKEYLEANNSYRSLLYTPAWLIFVTCLASAEHLLSRRGSLRKRKCRDDQPGLVCVTVHWGAYDFTMLKLWSLGLLAGNRGSGGYFGPSEN